MDIETKMGIVKSAPLEEMITEQEMRVLFETKQHPKHYLGLEISGMPHIGHLLFGGKKINDLASIGVETQVLLADWHTMANNKFGGDWDRIIRASGFYRKMFGIFCPKTKVVLGSDLYHSNDDYWKMIIQVARRTTMARATRTLIIEGRSEKDTLHVSQYIYPIMQAVDIHALGVDIPHAGMDQRRVHMLAKEAFRELKLGTIVPIHHHLMPSLVEQPRQKAEGESKEEAVAALKMSKSKPGSTVPVIATEEEISKTMRSAWCPERVVEGNPVLELSRYALLPISGALKIERKREYGGDVEYTDYAQLEGDFAAGKLHPMDLKAAAARALSHILGPVRGAFSERDLEVFRETPAA